MFPGQGSGVMIFTSRSRVEDSLLGNRSLWWVQRFTAVENSDFSPSGLTVLSDSPYDKETVPATHFKQ
jgi:hypothetical protein